MEAVSHPTPLPETIWSRVGLDYSFRYHFFLYFGQVQGRVLLCTPCVEVAGVAVRMAVNQGCTVDWTVNSSEEAEAVEGLLEKMPAYTLKTRIRMASLYECLSSQKYDEVAVLMPDRTQERPRLGASLRELTTKIYPGTRVFSHSETCEQWFKEFGQLNSLGWLTNRTLEDGEFWEKVHLTSLTRRDFDRQMYRAHCAAAAYMVPDSPYGHKKLFAEPSHVTLSGDGSRFSYTAVVKRGGTPYSRVWGSRRLGTTPDMVYFTRNSPDFREMREGLYSILPPL